MLSPFGRFCRKLRIDNGELLKEMAEKLGVTSSYLSAVENGKRNVPRNWATRISEIYSLDHEQSGELKRASEKSQLNNNVNLTKLNNEDRSLMVALARKIDGLNDDEKTIIKSILGKKGGNT